MEAEERDDLNEFRVHLQNQKKSHRRKCSQDTKHKNPDSLQISSGPHQHQSVHHGMGTQVLKPRISKLEHLEAKMASIEVSLSNGMEQGGGLGCKSGSGGGGVVATSSRTNKSGAAATSVEHQRLHHTNCTAAESTEKRHEVVLSRNLNVANERLRKFADEIDKLRDCLCEKDAIIGALREHTNQLLGLNNRTNNSISVCSNGGGSGHHTSSVSNVQSEEKSSNISKDKSCKEMQQQAKENKLKQLQEMIDNKICSVKDIRLKLNSLQVNDLDSRIHQAELEFLLEKEEMNILNLQQEQVNTKTTLGENHEENRFQKQAVDTSEAAVTVYSIVSCSQCTSLVAVDISYDVRSPCFYVTAHHSGRGLFVQWAKDTTKMKKGDRLLEVNGRIVAGCTKEEFLDLLWQSSNNGNILKVVVLRNTPMLPIRKGINKEVDNLKEEMSSIVNKLDTKIKENKELHLGLLKLQKDNAQYKEECQRLNHRAFFLEDQVSELLRLQRQKSSEVYAALPPSSSPSTINSSVVKSLSVSHLDSFHVQTTMDHHVLQVQIPFGSDERSGARVPSTQSSATAAAASKELSRPANVYTNVPFPVIVNKGQLVSQVSVRGRRCRGSADSDSGNYSGDSMDDAFTEIAQNMKQRLGSVNNFDHGYVNLIESHQMREAVTFGTVLTSKSVIDRKRNGSWPSTRDSSSSGGGGVGCSLHSKQIPLSRSQTFASKSCDGQSQAAVIQLKVNQVDKNEEWC